ncbi:MAG: hypothetical protein HYX48_04370 [Chlamydiales bacterium]|nr:hypothetical protein [Chlamydiales bacterium]
MTSTELTTAQRSAATYKRDELVKVALDWNETAETPQERINWFLEFQERARTQIWPPKEHYLPKPLLERLKEACTGLTDAEQADVAKKIDGVFKTYYGELPPVCRNPTARALVTCKGIPLKRVEKCTWPEFSDILKAAKEFNSPQEYIDNIHAYQAGDFKLIMIGEQHRQPWEKRMLWHLLELADGQKIVLRLEGTKHSGYSEKEFRINSELNPDALIFGLADPFYWFFSRVLVWYEELFLNIKQPLNLLEELLDSTNGDKEFCRLTSEARLKFIENESSPELRSIATALGYLIDEVSWYSISDFMKLYDAEEFLLLLRGLLITSLSIHTGKFTEKEGNAVRTILDPKGFSPENEEHMLLRKLVIIDKRNKQFVDNLFDSSPAFSAGKVEVLVVGYNHLPGIVAEINARLCLTGESKAESKAESKGDSKA